MKNLEIVPGRYAICKLRYITRSDMSLLLEEPFYNVSKSPEETTVVCREVVANEMSWTTEAREDGFSAIRVAGQIAFDETGVLAGLSAVLADAQISIFALSTFDTDYILLKTEALDAAKKALETAGYTIGALQKSAA